jgi:hypothetical protein
MVILSGIEVLLIKFRGDMEFKGFKRFLLGRLSHLLFLL